MTNAKTKPVLTVEEIPKNAKILSTFLGFEDHGILTAFVMLDYGGTVQGFGGWGLGGKGCAHFVKRVLGVVGVQKWEELPGKHLRAFASHDKVSKIGHILNDSWFDPAEEFKKMFPKEKP